MKESKIFIACIIIILFFGVIVVLDNRPDASKVIEKKIAQCFDKGGQSFRYSSNGTWECELRFDGHD